VLAAFDDVVQNELLPSGSMSSHEHFVGGGRLPSAPGANLAETCVTVTWLQLDAQLLQITGEQRFGAEIERSASNHLLAAQQPDGSAFCYYTALSGRKPYDRGITCCSSSGPRGLAMLPQQAVFTSGAAELAVNLLAAAHGSAVLDGHRVSFAVRSELPRHGLLRLEFGGELPATFALRLRLSDWALPATLRCGGEQRTVTAAGWCTIPARAWSPGESLQLLVRCGPTVVADAHDPDRLALQWGPCLLALPLAPDLRTAERVSLRAPNGKLLGGDAVKIAVELDRDGSSEVVTMVPFADAGADGMPFRVWLANAAIPVARVRASAQSRNGNVDGSIRDGDRDSFTVTWDGKAAAEDWYELQLPAPVALQRLSYAHGHCFHDGGWFDASKGKPKLQVQDRAGAAWRTVGALRNYPNTTATDHRGLRDGDVFVLELPEPVTAVAVRVVGVPACGDAPQQAFSSCAELQALQR
ncbi:MAG TPA: beta-L-arabinofuranosidase domain-containing protein, partial [Planctomycetota bacterium]|nr:beta-L-arabinofuranosidase domain-containing protein [Planctomycetota bacterium]